jgi:hypothetical protein
MIKEAIMIVYEKGIDSLSRKIQDPFTRRAALGRCRKCRHLKFDEGLWSCLECEFCGHLINHYLNEQYKTGSIVGKLDVAISNVFAQHFKKEIAAKAKKYAKKESE